VSDVYPVFVFDRRHDIELETGLVLAGSLIVDLPKNKKPKRRHQRMIAEIVQRLIEMARSGQMPANGIAYGWDGGRKPVNAVDTHDHALMTAWAKDCVKIRVRIDPRIDPRKGIVPLDSELLADIGLASNAPEKKQ
jgi:hypothetical protein